MLGKLFKYEVKATGRMILPFYAGLLGMTLLFRIFSAVLASFTMFSPCSPPQFSLFSSCPPSLSALL